MAFMPQRVLAVLALIVVWRALFGAATQGGPLGVPQPLFPANNWWSADITNAPTQPGADAMIAASLNLTPPAVPSQIGARPDFGGDSGDPEFPVYGFPLLIVDSTQAKLAVTFEVPEESDGVNHPAEVSFPFYPVPAEAITMTGWVEGGQPGSSDQRGDSDRHILIVDKTNNHLYELYNVWYNGTGWEAFSGAFFDMNTNNRRPDTWTSADAAGLAILPGLVRYEEVFGPNEIRHALRVTMRRTADAFVYPASHEAGSTAGALPMGARLRLKAGVNISSHPAYVQKIFRAFKKYGLIVADNGSNLYVSGEYNVLWDNDVLNPAFNALKATDFEVIQLGWFPPVTYDVTLPSTLGAGDVANLTVTVRNATTQAVVTGYVGTVSFTSSDAAATLPANYTFTPGDAGAHTFQVTLNTAGRQRVAATDAVDGSIAGSQNSIVGMPTPAGVIAAAATTTRIDVSWNSSPGATQYEITRVPAFSSPVLTSATSYPDSSVASGASYVYRVRALNGTGGSSGLSAADAATTIFFTNDALIANVDIITAAHIAEVRQAVNAMRTTAGLGAATLTDPGALLGVPVRTVHVQELRNALNQARTTLALGALGFTDPILTSGTTTVKAVHVQELRNGTK